MDAKWNKCKCGGELTSTAPSLYCRKCGFGKAAVAVDRYYNKKIETAEKEHERLSDAVAEFLHEYAPNEYGDMPDIMKRLAKQLKDGER